VSYDGRGNTVAETRPGGVAVAASYDGHARLESYDRTNIGAQTYSYNGLGDRVRVNKPTGTRHFVYDSQGRVVAEYGASASEVKAEFIWALPPAANDNSPFGGDDGIVGYAPLALVAENGLNQLELYWVHGNHLGVPIVTTNALGQVVDPGNDFLRPGFPGQSQVLSDLYYNRARDYDPVLGRYIQADPIGLLGDVNPYAYAQADPVNMIDPLGLFAGNPANFLPAKLRPPLHPATAGFALIGYLSANHIVPALQGALCRAQMGSKPNKWSQFYRHSMTSDQDEPEDECGRQFQSDMSDCGSWYTAPAKHLQGYSRTTGHSICERTARVRLAECRTKGSPSSPLFLPGSRRRNIHDGEPS
jgi:RHS repeat-associated protein